MNRLLWPVAAGFRVGVALRCAAYRSGWVRSRRLGRPVLSVGNLTVGGSGKTPLVMLLAERLRQRGWKPGILTRGYKRRRATDLITLAPAVERSPDPREVGDEPALLAKSLPNVPIVVCADRYRGGRVAEERFGVDVHLLDDGFQHLGLARVLDIVVVDVTRDCLKDALLPVGRLREPWSGLGRAHVVVLTRTELNDPQATEENVWAMNPQAKVFRSATVLHGLVDAATRQLCLAEALRGKPVGAFCGLGNPWAFFADLRHWGFSVVMERAFPDHHVYRPTDLVDLARRASERSAAALLTTEKDVMNLPDSWQLNLPVFACTIKLEIVGMDAFENHLFSALAAARGAS